MEFIGEGIHSDSEGRPAVQWLSCAPTAASARVCTWREQFLDNTAAKAFAVGKITGKEDRLLPENKRLKGVVGELTLELKKSDWQVGGLNPILFI
jgi:hypothetical protein